MTDGQSTFAPAFVIPDQIDAPGSHDASSRIADAEPSSLERMLARVYGTRIPESWQRVLDAPKIWLHDVAAAHRSAAEVLTTIRRRDCVVHALEQLRFEIAMSSTAGLPAFLTAQPRLRVARGGGGAPCRGSET